MKLKELLEVLYPVQTVSIISPLNVREEEVLFEGNVTCCPDELYDCDVEEIMAFNDGTIQVTIGE